MSESNNQAAPLGLPAPADLDGHEPDVSVPSIKLDELGPMIVNSNGVRILGYLTSRTEFESEYWLTLQQTLSRISNWQEMTEPERQRTLRVLGARNQ